MQTNTHTYILHNVFLIVSNIPRLSAIESICQYWCLSYVEMSANEPVYWLGVQCQTSVEQFVCFGHWVNRSLKIPIYMVSKVHTFCVCLLTCNASNNTFVLFTNLSRALAIGAPFTQKLHLIYLVNDVLHHWWVYPQWMLCFGAYPLINWHFP